VELCQFTDLLIKIDQFLIGKFQGLDSLKNSIPVTIVDIGYKAVHRVDSVERYTSLLLAHRTITSTSHRTCLASCKLHTPHFEVMGVFCHM